MSAASIREARPIPEPGHLFSPSFIDLELIQLRSEFERRGWPTESYCKYMRWSGLNKVDREISAHGAMPIITDVIWHPHMGRDCFTFAPQGPLVAGDAAVVFEVIGEDGETVVDMCAWSVEDPWRFATALRRADIAGEYWITAGARENDVLRVHRTPLAWMKSGCDGVVILERDFDAQKFTQWWGKIAGEDERHARELAQVLCRPPVAPEDILYGTEQEPIRRVTGEALALQFANMEGV